MKTELFIASRLQFASNRKKGKSPAIAIAVAGVAIAVIVMMVSVAVVLGFKNEIREKVTGFDSAITIRAYTPTRLPGQEYTTSSLKLNDSIRTMIYSWLPPETSVSSCITQPGILKTNDNFLGIVFNGIDADGDFSFLSQNMLRGNIPDYHDPECRNQIVISRTMANQLLLDTADKVHAYFIIDNNVRARNLTVAGIYDSNFGDYDRTYAFCDITLPQKMLRLDSLDATSLLINGIALDKIPDITMDLQNSLATAYYEGHTTSWYEVDNVYHSGALYFNWLDLLDTNVVVILILMALVSGFSLVSCLFIIILERVSTIGLLKAIGAPDRMIRHIFIYMAQRLVIRGMIIGNLVSITFMVIQKMTHILPLDPESYYLNHVPIEFSWPMIIALNVGIFIISWSMLLIPAHLIAGISPARTMHYE